VTPTTWPCPLPGGTVREYALAFDRERSRRLLIVPALFEEANRMRRLTVEVMRRLDQAGIDSFLPDLPGCNESPQPLDQQTPESWRAAMEDAATHFAATHVLAIRGGALVAPAHLLAWHYAPVKGAGVLRQQIRARIVTAREAGTSETQEGLIERALAEGIELSGHRLGADFVRQFQALMPAPGAQEIAQDVIGGASNGGGLWLRAEPDEDRGQADALAAILAIGIKA
jgi:hypothetical protein